MRRRKVKAGSQHRTKLIWMSCDCGEDCLVDEDTAKVTCGYCTLKAAVKQAEKAGGEKK